MSKKNVCKRRKRFNRQSPIRNSRDCHHLLFQRKHWNNGWAKLLREHWYFKIMIPRDTLHASIHSKIHDIPTPNGSLLKETYNELLRREKLGFISEKDSYPERINFLIELWEEKCPATVAILFWQKEVISKFYGES